MSKLQSRHIFTSESVSEGHPDKVADQVSDAVLDACLAQDPESRVAVETLVTTDYLLLAGEVTTHADVDWEAEARNVVRRIGYTSDDIGFNADLCHVDVRVHPQSPDISQGVTEDALHEQGAGDQGMMFGYASNETEALMPAPILYAHRIVERLAELRHTEPDAYPYLRPDSKSQVSFLYDEGRPVQVETVVVSHQHTPDASHSVLEDLVRRVVSEVVPVEFLHAGIRYFVNPTGRFVIGGPNGDTGLTGRKIIVDTYGGVGCHGGGAFSGKDPSKVDRSAAYKCRHLAKNIVAAGLAAKCEVQVAYAIGVAAPVSFNLETFGTGCLPDEELVKLIQEAELFDLKPASIIRRLGLKHPSSDGWSYVDTAAYGHFGRPQFPWERTDKAEALRALAEEHQA